MALIHPFKAVRPTPNKAALVASRSYEAYAQPELQSELRYNPLSFLHVLDPGFTFKEPLAGTERFQQVYNRYQEFLAKSIFQKEDNACFYLYQIAKEDRKTLSFFCTCSLDDYQNDVIKKHEDTLQHRKAVLADYMYTTGFSAEPVLITYPDHKGIDQIFQAEILRVPEYDFTTAEGARHTLWKIATPEIIAKLTVAFASIPALYIADGHHRSASSLLTAQKIKTENPSHTGNEAYNFFMACLIPESQITIRGVNRMVKDLKGYSKNDFLTQLNTQFHVEKKDQGVYPLPQKHCFSMYLDGAWYTLNLRRDRYTFTDALSALDPQILYKTLLEPLLGISDLRNDQRLAYACGSSHHTDMKARIDQGEFAVGFNIAPITTEEIKSIAHAGLVMPPKSTYIEPKLLSGLTIYELYDWETLKLASSRYK